VIPYGVQASIAVWVLLAQTAILLYILPYLYYIILMSLCLFRCRKTIRILWPEHQLHERWAFPMLFYQVGNFPVLRELFIRSHAMLLALLFLHCVDASMLG